MPRLSYGYERGDSGYRFENEDGTYRVVDEGALYYEFQLIRDVNTSVRFYEYADDLYRKNGEQLEGTEASYAEERFYDEESICMDEVVLEDPNVADVYKVAAYIDAVETMSNSTVDVDYSFLYEVDPRIEQTAQDVTQAHIDSGGRSGYEVVDFINESNGSLQIRDLMERYGMDMDEREDVLERKEEEDVLAQPERDVLEMDEYGMFDAAVDVASDYLHPDMSDMSAENYSILPSQQEPDSLEISEDEVLDALERDVLEIDEDDILEEDV